MDLQIVSPPHFLHFEHFLYELALLVRSKYLLKKSILLVSLVCVSAFNLSYVKPDFYWLKEQYYIVPFGSLL